MLWSLLWWGVVFAAALQALRAWGRTYAVGATLLLILASSWLSSLLPTLGWLVTLLAAVHMGATAERELARQRSALSL
jgi:hypothetical protein